MRSCKTCRHTLGGEHCWGCNYSTGLHKWEPKPTTNADRIRSMTDEELATLFGVWVADCDNNDVPCKKYCDDYKSCGDAWLAWLKEEVSE